MKSLLKRTLRALWRSASPLRRPVRRKLDAYLDRELAPALRARLQPDIDRLEAASHGAARASRAMSQELNLVLNSLVREVTRLQMQVEILEQALHDGAATRGGPSLLSADVDEGDDFAPRASERLKVG